MKRSSLIHAAIILGAAAAGHSGHEVKEYNLRNSSPSPYSGAGQPWVNYGTNSRLNYNWPFTGKNRAQRNRLRCSF